MIHGPSDLDGGSFATPSQCQIITPRRLFSPRLSPHSLPQHGTFAESDYPSIGGISAPRSILGRRARSCSPHSTPRNRRCLEFGQELSLAGFDEWPIERPICDVGGDGHTEGARGHAGDLTNDADMNDDAASDQGIENSGILEGKRGRGRGGRGRRGRGRGGGGNSQPRCPPRGAIAPSAWVHDPRVVHNSDLQEEIFEPSQIIQGHVDNQLQQPGPIPGSSARPEPEIPAISCPGYHFVLDLAVACRKVIDNQGNSQDPMHEIFEILQQQDQPSKDAGKSRLLSIMTVDTLENIADRCIMAEENEAVTNFVFMVNAIQLRCKVIRSVLSNIFAAFADGDPYPVPARLLRRRRHLFLKASRAVDAPEH